MKKLSENKDAVNFDGKPASSVAQLVKNKYFKECCN